MMLDEPAEGCIGEQLSKPATNVWASAAPAAVSKEVDQEAWPREFARPA